MTLTKQQIESKLRDRLFKFMSVLPKNMECKSYNMKMVDAIKKHAIVTGGIIPSFLIGEEPNDFDLYFDNVHVVFELVSHFLTAMGVRANYDIEEEFTNPDPNFKWHQQSVPGTLTITIKKHDEDGIQPHVDKYYGDTIGSFNDSSCKPKLITSNALTFSDKTQLITRNIGNPGEIHKTFDFVHCVSYYTFETGLVFNKFAMESILTRELKYKGTIFPVEALFRANKFVSRGWTISQKEMMKIIMDVMQTPFTKESMAFQLQTGINNKWTNFVEKFPPDIISDTFSRTDFYKLVDTR